MIGRSAEDGVGGATMAPPPARQTRTRARQKRAGSPASQIDSDVGDSDCSTMSLASIASGTSTASRNVTKRKRSEINEDEALNPSQTRAKTTLPTVEELGMEMKLQPTGDLGARIRESLETIEKVAVKSKNIKGDLVREVRKSVRIAQAAAVEIAQRTVTEKENAALRQRVAELNKRVDEMAKEMSALRGGAKGSSEKAGSPMRDRMMDQIGLLIEEKLAQFKRELFPDRAIRPPLGVQKAAETQSAPAVATTPSTAPPTTTTPLPVNTTWAKVASKKGRATKNKKTASTAKVSEKPAGATGQPGERQKGPKKSQNKPPKVPKTAAITLTVEEGAGITYAQVMKAAKEKVKLADVGITQVKQKRGINGGLVLEIEGEGNAAKADALAVRMREALVGMSVRIARPVKSGEIRVMDLDDSVTPRDVAIAIAEACDCVAEELRVGEIRRNPSSLGTVWVRCPLTVVRALADAKRLRVGWVSARVEVLAARALLCYRCLEKGHVRHQCPNVDRSNLCYMCGESSHKASECPATKPKCFVCAHHGLPADHRVGSKSCTPPPGKKVRGGKKRAENTKKTTEETRAGASAQGSGPSEEMET